MRVLELKVPPPAVALVTAVLMWLASRSSPALTFVFPASNLLAVGLAAIGLTVAISGVVTFRRARTTLNPTKPEASSSLVSWGIYKITRNPMYLGLLLVLTAGAIFLSNWLAFLFLPVFVAYIDRFQIVPEERALTSLFAREFVHYQSRVRRWL
ncbi:MAG TPA: isoprenylcysteine carboxylmethyltransferase family protein [Bryobacteraceae bacterium]|jgi:protein-S-isoprenylcysteine O-methyltransferase Ste14|nr:isoprenylcysteine carboxylmethyltransferase family protein [Bryobacteraceae bacterium]